MVYLIISKWECVDVKTSNAEKSSSLVTRIKFIAQKNALHSLIMVSKKEKEHQMNQMKLKEMIQKLSPLARLRLNYMREIIGGVSQNITPVQFINTHKRCDPMLAWLLKNKLTGMKFHLWFIHEMNHSLLQMVAELNKRIEKDQGVKTPVRQDFR